jgi:Family of unknown function (DUF6600)
MRKRPLVLTLAGILTVSLAILSTPARAEGVPAAYVAGTFGPRTYVDIGYFWDALAPYGEWVETDEYGWAWKPAVWAAWRPYTYGNWVYTDCGWTWDSDFRWGWAPFHYGRWTFDDEYGWVWVPGSTWGPAWVAWREGGGLIGWAPLPPDRYFLAGLEVAGGRLAFDVSIPVGEWSFVDARYITDPAVRRYIFSPNRVRTYYRYTRNVTNYSWSGNRVVDNSLSVNRVERVTHRRVRRYEIRNAGAPIRTHGTRVSGRSFLMYRPRVPRTRTRVTPSHARRRQRAVPRNSYRGTSVRRSYRPPRGTLRVRPDVTRRRAPRPPTRALHTRPTHQTRRVRPTAHYTRPPRGRSPRPGAARAQGSSNRPARRSPEARPQGHGKAHRGRVEHKKHEKKDKGGGGR